MGQSILPGFKTIGQLDTLFIMLVMTFLSSSLCATDRVMVRLREALKVTLAKLEQGSFWPILFNAWVPEEESPSAGWPWMVLLVPVLSCRASTGQIVGMYSSVGMLGSIFQAWYLRRYSPPLDTDEKNFSLMRFDEDFFEDPLNDRDRAIYGKQAALQGLKGAVCASFVETAYKFYPAIPPFGPLLACGIGTWSVLFFYSDIFPHRLVYREMETDKPETCYEKSVLRTNQFGALSGFLLMSMMARFRLLKPPVLI
eukprot:CAMPEP_0167761696 /NCGR_PEP_ID=MMETSP0110_2-20121227/12322_1 /TAXON_ID=629695 /ORGANISM="Gymnochlora sp., Strain CCMP2014" /LENGTH=254 /DNA_ID=CAMNT_0007648421 /DNA_START=142 /DNA_END=906 /DNA_ORIENTATION=-